MKSHFIDIDTIVKIEMKYWVIDKTNPNIPILKISQSDFNLMVSGIFKSHNNKIEFNGKTFWVSNKLSSRLKVISKNQNLDFSNLAISRQEFLNKEIIDNLPYEIKVNNFKHLINSPDDIYIILSKQNKKTYQKICEELSQKLKEMGLVIKDFYFIADNISNINDDTTKYKKMKIMLQHLLGYRTDGKSFTDNEIPKYSSIYYYDNNYDTLKIADEINQFLKLILSKTDNGLREVIKEDITEYKPQLIVNYISDNQVNRTKISKCYLSYDNIIKTFESFGISKINESTISFFEKIQEWDYDMILCTKSCKIFDKKYYDQFDQFLLSNSKYSRYKYHEICHYDDRDFYNICEHTHGEFWEYPKVNDRMVNITQCDDEWFLVSVDAKKDRKVSTDYYKCDQVEGVIELLKIIL